MILRRHIRILLVLVGTILSVFPTYAQTEEVSFVDIYGQIHYSTSDFGFIIPKEGFFCSGSYPEYRRGCIIEQNENQNCGWINFDPVLNKIFFKTDREDAKRKSFKAKDCKMIVIEKDTFLCFKKFNQFVNDSLVVTENSSFFKKVLTLNRYDVLEFRYNKNGKDLSDFYIKNATDDEPHILSVPLKFLDSTAIHFFNTDSLLQPILEKKTMNYHLIGEFLLNAYYHQFKLKNKPIYYDTNFNQVLDSTFAVYKGFISETNYPFWKVDIYKSNVLICNVSLNGFYPTTKHGKTVFYYPNKEIKKSLTYDKGELISQIQEYYPNGVIRYEYTQNKERRIYTIVSDTSGNNLLNRDGECLQQIFEKDRTIERYFKNHQLFYSIATDTNNKMMVQYHKKTNKGSNLYFDDILIYPPDASSDKAQGVVFVKFQINAKGECTDIQIQNSIHKICDDEALMYLKSTFGKERWTTIKHQNTSPEYEVNFPAYFIFNEHKMDLTIPTFNAGNWYHENYFAQFNK